jgi:hypothetical protein
VGGGKLLILPFKFLLRHHRRDRSRKSGGPPLFVPSLKVQVQGDDTHNGMILITTPGFDDLTPSIAKQLPGVVRMAMGTSVFRIRIELIFRRCWNLITPWGRSAQRRGESAAAPVCDGSDRPPSLRARRPNPHRWHAQSHGGHSPRAARDKRRLHEPQRWRRKTHLGLLRPLQSFWRTFAIRYV